MLSVPNKFKFYSEPGGEEGYVLNLENFPIELDQFPESYFKKIFIDNFTRVQKKYMSLKNFMDLDLDNLDDLFYNESIDNPFLVKNVLGNYKIVDINVLLTDNYPVQGRFYTRCDLMISIKQYIDDKREERGGYLVAKLSSNAYGCRVKKNQQVWNQFMKDCKIALGNVLNQILKTEQVNLLGYEQFSRFALDKGLQTTNLPLIGSFLGPTQFDAGKEAAYNNSSTKFLSRDPSRPPDTFIDLDLLNLKLTERSNDSDLESNQKKPKLQGGNVQNVQVQKKKKSKTFKSTYSYSINKSIKRSKRKRIQKKSRK
jgi:hypothetical protein